MKSKISLLLPSKLEVIGAGFLTLLILLLANSKQLLGYYGLTSSNELITSNAGNVVNDGLSKLDAFSATTSVVTFLIWAIVGFACFSLIEAFAGALQRLKLQKQVSSRTYVQPSNFSKQGFWRSVVIDTISLLAGLIVLGIVLFVLILIGLPLSLAYSQVFLFGGGVTTVGYMLIGIALLMVNLLLVAVVLRYLLNRRKIIRL